MGMRNGAKYFEWERKGVPLRIELGPRDVENGVCIFKYRATLEDKVTVDLENAAEAAVDGLDTMQAALLAAANDRLKVGITRDAIYGEMKEALKCDAKNEDKIKEECKATIRCYPLEENKEGCVDGKTCFYSGEPATHMALFGR